METEKKIAGTKWVASRVAEKSVTFVVAGAIAAITPAENRRQRVQRFVGSYVIAGMVAKKASSFVNEEIDEIVETWSEIKAMFSFEEKTEE